jgi:small subunit ribosomal protein S6
MRVYEELFILKPDAPEEEVDGFVEQIKSVITTGNGTVDKVDKWGVRKLAYRVSKYNEGIYVLVVFSSTPELVHEVERRMRMTDMVIKFITVRIDEKLKKIEKRKKARDKRAARKPPPQVASPQPPQQPAMPAEHGAAPGMPVAEGAKPEPAKAEHVEVKPDVKPAEPVAENAEPVSAEKE